MNLKSSGPKPQNQAIKFHRRIVRPFPALFVLIILTFAALGRPSAFAVTNLFITVADTSLLEIAPNNNHGGFIGMNAGTTQNFTHNRALFRFDLSSLPTNTIVLAATVQLVVTRQPGLMEPINSYAFGLHRMLVAWGEGNKNPSPTSPFAGSGLPASPGEATWNYAFYPTNAWATPGGASGVDYSSVESSFEYIYGTDQPFYRFPSNPEMIADVVAWLHHPQTNFGWMLLCADESTQSTARRWGTREDLDHQPFLEVQYLVPPTLQIVKTNATQVQLHFPAWADHNYDVRYRNSLTTGSWLLLTNLLAAPTNHAATIADSTSSTQRFYQISAY